MFFYSVLRNVTTVIDNIVADVAEAVPAIIALGAMQRLITCLSVEDESVAESCAAVLSRISEDSEQFATQLYTSEASSTPRTPAATATATASEVTGGCIG